MGLFPVSSLRRRGLIWRAKAKQSATL